MAIEVTYLGHATALIELAGARLLTDPVLRARIGYLRRHAGTIDRGLLGRPDALLISHPHYDHLDRASLKLIDRATPVVIARGAGRFVSRIGFENVIELSPGERAAVAGLELLATEAEHPGGRLIKGRTEAVGFVIEGASERVYFAGDTDRFEAMSELAPLDLALLPVWGWGTRLGFGHLDPRGAAQALRQLQPSVAIPIHWGTLFPIGLKPFRGRLLHEPPREFAEHARREAPDVDVRIVEPGDKTVVG